MSKLRFKVNGRWVIGGVSTVNNIEPDDEGNLILPIEDPIINSSTPGSTKKFRITIDDSGTISATEITE